MRWGCWSFAVTLVLALSSGCYGIRVTTATRPQQPAYKATSRIPIPGDDLGLEGLRTAAEASKLYYSSLTAPVYFTLDRDTYSSDQLSRSVDHFLAILSEARPDRLDSRIARECRSYRPRQQDAHFTAYFEPVLRASLSPDDRYRYPLYRRPDELTLVQLNRFFPGDRRRIDGVVRSGELFPYLTRAEIDGQGLLRNRGLELAWVDDPVALFFLHIQGSGRLALVDGSLMRVNFAGSNGLPYASVGRYMLDNGIVESGSNATIQTFLLNNPDRRETILFQNRRYIFFRPVVLGEHEGPIGSLGVPLVAGRSVATDSRYVPPGALMYIRTRQPVVNEEGQVRGWRPVSRFAFAHDTGAAIKGPARGDIFWGTGEKAGETAGYLNERGAMLLLVCGVEPLSVSSSVNAGAAYTTTAWDDTLRLASLH